MNILDVGVGSGGFSEILNEFPRFRRTRGSWLNEYGGSNAYGVDIDSDSIEKTKKRINNGTHFLIMDINHLSFTDGFFNVIHANDVLCTAEMLMEINRVLSKTGILVFNMSINNFVSLFSSGFFIFVLDAIFSISKWKLEFVSDEYMNVFRDSGFKITAEEYYWYFEILGWTNLWFCNCVSRLLKITKLDRVFCRKMVVTAIKL